MTERLLQYIWQYQYFNANDLQTTSGEKLVIVHPGQFNRHQGPDFKEGKVKIGANIWVGNVELHLNASDWHKHSHGGDPNYKNVILHVVWSNDEHEEVSHIPTLVLHDRIPKMLLQQYAAWMKSDRFIACEASVSSVDPLTWSAWKSRLMIERLERKGHQVMMFLSENSFHWEEAMWWMTARNFGLYINAEAFGEMALSVPYNLVKKHRNQIHQLEALLMGQCGLLDDVADDKYALMLKKEYAFLKNKYALQRTGVPVHFLRMRPACFPTVRLAQLAMLLHTTDNVFSSVINAECLDDIRSLLGVTANDYWHYHFRFGESTLYQPKTLGADMINSIIVNTVIVMLFVYGKYHNEEMHQLKALEWLEYLPAESNGVIAKFKALGVEVKHACDSQSLIELKSQFCDRKRCLDCAVANNLLKRNSPQRRGGDAEFISEP